MGSKRQLVWFRTDLRCEDNTALHHAAQCGPVIGVVCWTPQQWREHGHGDNKLDFWRRGIEALSNHLDRLNIPLRIIDAEHFGALPDRLLELAETLECEAIHFNDEYGLNERCRDRQVSEGFHQRELAVHRYTDQIAFTPGELLTGDGRYYSVFTPFYKSWLKNIGANQLQQFDAPEAQAALSDVVSDELPELKASHAVINSDDWPAGEEAAQDRLARFLQKRAHQYDSGRDFPAMKATSGLSAWLALGMMSWRQCINAAAARNGGHLGDGDSNLKSWISEIIWREFYQHVLVGFPRVNRHQPFQEHTKALAWRDSDEDFQRWCEGNTGYPLVDAAMRQLTTTGWMHNRLRMVTAMFLSKHLLIDWRRGEAFFLQHLVDGELGANNGGWQWAASTGTDAAPYFRIFNPTTQSRRFDPEGMFIAEFVPELANVEAKKRHAPDAATCKHIGYPLPMVDHRAARQRALDAFKALS
ncbi:deoxyribodipyrimidine photo-lyase [Kushneria marisflavi]|uniref:Deoxyribodipyrimidine photo-lyase n=1 Tax=Kushneria marisflavi TaxID=157779 RepID=A0A240UR97_9GAMM|nr:deoxyribodipyrimidine photo-lyase [Kushneria marisflavi]ART63635.1 deoxyribodipyrimidine photo-lyase [Kushneria marisflavi]RKD85301.1 deoxyribodipyrimidine photo-lyase type I [Kushneria marisflavi]